MLVVIAGNRCGFSLNPVFPIGALPCANWCGCIIRFYMEHLACCFNILILVFILFFFSLVRDGCNFYAGLFCHIYRSCAESTVYHSSVILVDFVHHGSLFCMVFIRLSELLCHEAPNVLHAMPVCLLNASNYLHYFEVWHFLPCRNMSSFSIFFV